MHIMIDSCYKKGTGRQFFFLFWKDNVTANFSISNFQVDFFCLVEKTRGCGKFQPLPQYLLKSLKGLKWRGQVAGLQIPIQTTNKYILSMYSLRNIVKPVLQFYSYNSWICRTSEVPDSLLRAWVFWGGGVLWWIQPILRWWFKSCTPHVLLLQIHSSRFYEMNLFRVEIGILHKHGCYFHVKCI
jgi:hypothetical protein